MGSFAYKPHAVCMPNPAQGHIKAMLHLAKLLHLKGFHITFVHSESNYSRILKSCGAGTLDGSDSFRFETIPYNLNRNIDPDAFDETRRSQCLIPFRDVLLRLNDESSGVPPVTCIISDSFTSYTIEPAAELHIRVIFFCSVSACSYMCFLHCTELIQRGVTPLKSEGDLTNGYLDTPIDWIPGLKNMRLKDLPTFIRTTNPKDLFLTFTEQEVRAAFKASAIVINTFDELEGQVVDAMAVLPGLPPVYTIGPLPLFSHQFPLISSTPIGSSLWKEDNTWVEWLEEKEKGSVVYVNYGSITVMSNEQLVEFAWGLVNSNHYFFWIIRPDLVKGESAVLPQELQEEIRAKGLVASWCPQDQVLSHPSIGGFLTHCGWNSMTESLCAGVPMICWPYFADQQTNCRYACAEWGIGLEIDSDVKREQVAGLVKEMMEGEKGKEMKQKVIEWKEKAAKATEPGGSSFVNLEKVIADVLLQRNSVDYS